jgi:serine/threonine protein kinase
MKNIDIIQVFNTLKLPNWSFIEKLKSGGQADVIILKNQKSCELGVFRLLRSNREIDIKRFIRELEILSDPKNYHPNLVRIFDYSHNSDHYWYISEKGADFQFYWNKIKTENQLNPDKIVSLGIEICLKLLKGLEVLHFQKIVHRDIKPANIVIVKSEPVLIDFGLAYIEGQDRVTPTNEAVGNAKYSPTEMMYRLDEIPAWLDIFMVSQLLIWMLSEKPIKDNWIRPLDWRWVKYLEGISAENILALKAMTALCSEQTTSPQNASEMTQLINKLLHLNTVPYHNNNLQEIVAKIKQGNSQNIILNSELRSRFIASFPTLELFVGNVKNHLKSLEGESNDVMVIEFIEYDLNVLKWKDSILKSANFENIEKALNPFSLKGSLRNSAYFFQIAINIELLFDKNMDNGFLPFLVKLVFGANKGNMDKYKFEYQYMFKADFKLFKIDSSSSIEVSEMDFFDLIKKTIFKIDIWEELLNQDNN